MVFDKKAYMKEYRERNKEKLKEYHKEYQEKNREKFKSYRQTEIFKKSHTIGNWKYFGLIHDDYDALYDKYINTKSCEVCNKVFENNFERCMDHDHDTGEFRKILCRSCNNYDYWLKIQNNNL